MDAADRWSFLPQLSECTLFAGLPESILVAVLWRAAVLDFSAGTPIVHRGGPSDTLLVLVEGLAAVTHEESWVSGAEAISWIKPGESIGEVGILTAHTRSATVTAVTPVRALCIQADTFTELMGLHPLLGLQLSRQLARRLANNMFIRRMAHNRGQIIAVLSDPQTPSGAMLDSIAETAEGTVYTMHLDRADHSAPDTEAAVSRMIAASQHLDKLITTVDLVVVSVPSDIDPAAGRPVLERADLILVSPSADGHPLRKRLRDLAGDQNPCIVQIDYTPQSTQAIFDRLGRPHEVTVFVPTTVDVDQEIDATPHIESAKALFGDCFGGATVREAEGVWKSEDLGLVGERIIMVSAACSPTQLNHSLDQVTAFVLGLKETMRQEAMAMHVDGRLILL